MNEMKQVLSEADDKNNIVGELNVADRDEQDLILDCYRKALEI